MLSSAAAAALSTLPRSFRLIRALPGPLHPHLTSLMSQHELDPTQRKAEATDFPVLFFFFFSFFRLDRSRARRINAVTGDNKTIFYAAVGQLLLPTSFRDHAYVRAANCPRRQRHFRWIYVLLLGNQKDFVVSPCAWLKRKRIVIFIWLTTSIIISEYQGKTKKNFLGCPTLSYWKRFYRLWWFAVGTYSYFFRARSLQIVT